MSETYYDFLRTEMETHRQKAMMMELELTNEPRDTAVIYALEESAKSPKGPDSLDALDIFYEKLQERGFDVRMHGNLRD